MESLKEKTAKGLFWGALNNGVTQLLGALFGILLGRLLSPEDYSMMTMIAVFSQVAAIVHSSGFTTALVNLKEPEDNDYNSVFWFNIFVGLALYAILFLCAPLIASYYHTPELKWFCRYAFLGFLFANIGTAQGAWLQKNLRVKQQAKAGIAAVLLSSSIGVSMTWAGFSYWSLATQSIVYILTVALMRWHYSPWRPSLRVDFGPVRRMFPFSVKILGAGIVDAININVLNILLGRYFTKHDTGCYNQAYQWQSKCNYVPGYFFVALLRVYKGQYNAIGLLFKHEDNTDAFLGDYAMSIDQLEALTGFDFFCNLPDSREKVIESTYNPSIWGFKKR